MRKAGAAEVGQFVRHYRHQSLSSGVCLNIGQIRRAIRVNADGSVKVRKDLRDQKPSASPPYLEWIWEYGDYEILPPDEVAFLLLSGEI